MKIEYLLKGIIENCPHVCIYDFDNTEARQLRELFIELAVGENDRASFQDIDGAEQVGGCNVTMKVGAWDRGLKSYDNNKRFEWILTEESWQQMADIAEAFCDEDCEHEQEWLDKKGDVPLLMDLQYNSEE